MATYKEVKGVTVQTRDTDPTLNIGTWSSGGALNQGRSLLGGFGAPTGASANIVFGGDNPATASDYAITESYNGTSWTEVGDLNQGRTGVAGFGTTTAGFAIGGNYSGAPGAGGNQVESWNGSAWTETTEINSARIAGVATGITTAGLFSTGTSPTSGSPSSVTLNESWNGSAWTEVGDLNQARRDGAGSGTTNTAALVFGGRNPPANTTGLATNELWNGSSWTETGDLNLARMLLSGSGSSTAAIAFAGNNPTPGRLTQTEQWDGTSWTEVNDLANARMGAASGTVGTSTSSLASGGETTASPDTQALTEEWNFPSGPHLNEGDIFLSGGTTLKGFGKAAGIPAATFASGASLNTARGYLGGAGTDHEALLAFGGTTGPATQSITEQYDGSSWTEVNDLNTARANVTGFGSSTAAIAGNGSTPTKAETESWNGSAWSEIAELNFSRSDSASAGTQTSGMIATGTPVPGNPSLRPGGSSIVTEVWNGSAWTEVGDTNTQRLQAGMAMGGSITAGIITAGEDGPGSRTVNAETWNGTSWTEVGNISQQRGSVYNFMGNSSSANIAGGYSGTARVANNEHWNGSSWTEINDLSTARNATYGGGSAVNGAVFGGDTGDYQSLTEEFISDDTLSSVSFD